MEVTIDTLPWVPTFVEFEGSTEKLVKEVASDFGFDWDKAMHGSVETIYQLPHFKTIDLESYCTHAGT